MEEIKRKRKKRAYNHPRSDKGKEHKKASEGDKRIGNDFHLLRMNIGARKIFSDPDELMQCAVDYKNWCDKNKITRNEMIKTGARAGDVIKVEMPRIMTMGGFASYLGITQRTLNNYGSGESHKEFHESFQMISDFFDYDKISNGAVGNYSEKIVMSLVGLRENKDVKITPVLNFGKELENV